MYEVTSKMVADIYTKAFTDAVRWKHACLLINIFQGEEMVDKDVLDALRPTHDVKSGTSQASTSHSLPLNRSLFT